jgi:hypothetical protein
MRLHSVFKGPYDLHFVNAPLACVNFFYIPESLVHA